MRTLARRAVPAARVPPVTAPVHRSAIATGPAPKTAPPLRVDKPPPAPAWSVPTEGGFSKSRNDGLPVGGGRGHYLPGPRPFLQIPNRSLGAPLWRRSRKFRDPLFRFPFSGQSALLSLPYSPLLALFLFSAPHLVALLPRTPPERPVAGGRTLMWSRGRATLLGA